jgi:hypothetical protein
VSAPDRTEDSVLPSAVTEEPVLLPADSGVIREAVHAEFDEVLPYVLEALRRNNAFDEINERLRLAERRIEARQERPVIVGVHSMLDRMRHLDFDEAVKQALEDDIVRVLTDAGYEETGQVGEDYDPSRHDAIGGRAVDGTAVVTEVHTHGLISFGDVVVRARVEISPAHQPCSGG